MSAVNHIGFIVAAYSAAVIIVGALIAWVMVDFRIQRRILTELEVRGVTRRSTRAAERSMQQASEQA